jgi:hypothetical protein
MSDDTTTRKWRGRRPAVAGLRVAGLVVGGVIGAGIFALAFGWLVMILWNWIMPGIFSLPAIGYWQGFGIVILAKLIFGAVGGGRHWGHRPWHRPPDPMGGWHGPGRDWRLWRQFWEEEGRESFQRYAERRTGGQTPPTQEA